MAKGEVKGKKPRIRKTAPSVRQRTEAAQSKIENKKPSRLKRIFGKIRLPKFLLKILRPIGRGLKWLVPRYFINSWREVKQVTWPSRRETWRLTGAVFVFATVFGILVTIVDKGLDELFKKFILK